MKTVKELKKILDRSGNASLTLMNSQSESFVVGQPDLVVRVGSKLKLRWPLKEHSHAYRFNYAVIHNEDEIYLAKQIDPISIGSAGSLELVFDYNS